LIIAVDCRHLGSSGIGVYLAGCLPYFFAAPHEYILFGGKKKLESFVQGAAKKYASKITIIDCAVKPFSVRELFFFFASAFKKNKRRGRVFFAVF
jgi:hypothetical protein